ncbi:glycoside hydrolase superfamily, partial [Coemansia spiralis]
SASASSLWQPTAGTTWQIELLYALNDTSIDVDVYDIDLFTNSASTISSLHSAGRKVICYFDAGALGTWEPDVSEFEVSDLGSVMNGWPDEKWLNITSPNVRIIMAKRLDLAQQKGCDGVDPDNVDAYNNGNGLGLTQDDAIDYINWMAGEAHARGLSIGLKNALAVIDSVIDNMQWSVDELCVQYNECSKLFAFTKRNMPVFHIEYPKGSSVNNNDGVTSAQKTAACAFDTSNSFSTLIKNILLDNWRETC